MVWSLLLRELTPATYRQGRMRFWVRRERHRSVLTEDVELDRSLVTRLSHVEMCFDETAKTVCEDVPEADLRVAANATGRWLAELCREELRARSRAGRTGFFVPDEWQLQRVKPRFGPRFVRVRRRSGLSGLSLPAPSPLGSAAS